VTLTSGRAEGGPVATPSLSSWHPGSHKFGMLAGVLLLVFGVYSVAYWVATLTSGAPHLFGDAFGLWSWARFLDTHPASEIYDPAALHTAQVALGFDRDFSFAYPPTFLLVLRPMGLLPCAVAIAAMIAVTGALYLWATVGREWRSSLLLAAIVAPTTTMTIVAGQCGFLTAALLIGGFRLVDRRPILAGVLFGLLSYKPQFGLLVPVALLAARLWSSIAAGAITVVALVIATSALFGATVWPSWIATLPAYSHHFAAESSGVLHLMPTVLATLLQFGVSPAIAGPMQWSATIAAGVIVWISFRFGQHELAVAGLVAASFLATPYAFVYDMPTVTTAVLWVIAERRRSGDSFGSDEVLVLMLAMIAPITLPAGAVHFPLVAVSLVLLLVVILRRIWSLRSRALAVPALPEAA